jgi:uncharacterized protein (TIGR02466 family)
MSITEIIPLFPKLLITGKLSLDNDALITDLKKKFSQGDLKGENTFSKTDPYLHNESVYQELVQQIIKFVNDVTNDIFEYENAIPEITLMWGTCSEKDRNVHRHYHPNSFFSGVYYPQDIEYAPIRFYTPYLQMLLPRKRANNIHNAHCIPIQPKQGDIFLFPSELEHDTIENFLEENRLSIAFNIFFKGSYGDDSVLTTLKI